MKGAGVPDEFREPRTQRHIALELLDRVRAEGLAGSVVVADAGYGNCAAFRDGLTARGLSYVVGVQPETVVFAEQPRWVRPDRGRRGGLPRRWVLTANSPRPEPAGALAGRLRFRRVAWRARTKGKLSARFAWVRVWQGADWDRGVSTPPEPARLLVERRDDGEVHHAMSNLPDRTLRSRAVRVWEQRWRVEQGHQQMKEELGRDHFEGRSWRGFHHHATMVLLAYGFLLLEQTRSQPKPVGSGKKGRRTPADGPGHPAGAPAPAPTAGQTRLPLLPRSTSTASNGVVLTGRHSDALLARVSKPIRDGF
jgi:SRSO17 transposase